MLSDEPKGVFAALAEAFKAVGVVPKNGYNPHGKYHYVTEGDMSLAVREAFAKNDLFWCPIFKPEGSVRDVMDGDRKKGQESEVVFSALIYHKDGSFVEVGGYGHAKDPGMGDKCSYKAMTGAVKYVLYKMFLVPAGMDVEEDEHAGVNAPAPPKKSKAPPKKLTKKQEDLPKNKSEQEDDLTPASKTMFLAMVQDEDEKIIKWEHPNLGNVVEWLRKVRADGELTDSLVSRTYAKFVEIKGSDPLIDGD